MDLLIHDLRYALRRLGRAPGFAAVAVLTLALGIGANTAIYSVVDAVLLRPLPYADGERVALVWQPGEEGGTTWLSPAEVVAYREGAGRTFSGFSAYTDFDANLTGGAEPERIPAAYLLPDAFRVLGVGAAVGRTFSEEDAGRPGDVVVLSHDLWRRRFAEDPGVIGTRIPVNGEPRTVIGVMPPDFRLPLDYREAHPTELWIPLAFDAGDLTEWGNRYLIGFGRLRDDATPAAATAELGRLEEGWVRQGFLRNDDKLGRLAVPVRELVFGDVRPALLVVFGAVGLVLLIACANVANLLLARADRRQREVAVRTALGARRRRVVAQLLTESVVLGGLGALLGAVLAQLGIDLLVALRPDGVPRIEQAGLDGGVLAFTAALGLATGILFGIAPALRLARPDLSHALRDGGRGSSGGVGRQAVRRALVVGEVALSVVLVVAAGLLIRSFMELQRIRLGFEPDDVLTVQLALPQADYPDPESVVAFYRDLVGRAGEIPGVESAAAVRILPLTGTIGDWSITVEGRTTRPGDNPNGDWQVVTPGYFETMGISLVSGRLLADSDHEGSAPVVVINQTMAARYWPGEDPVGRRFHLGTMDQPWMTIVGVTRPVRHNAVVEEPRAEMYLPHAQFPLSTSSAPRGMTLVMKTAGPPLDALDEVRAAVRAIDPDLPISEARTLEQVVSRAFARPRFVMLLLGLFAGVAILLAAVGIYGVISLLVAQRSHEIGIRLALGAERRSILALVVGEGMLLAAAGIALGLLGAGSLGRVMEGLVYGVRPLDLPTFAAVPALLALVALLACWLPARRATRVDPMAALRAE